MPVEIKVPSVGESINEGSIARWIKSDGDVVQQDEPIFELETEKATQEIPAPASGVLHIKAKAGEHVAIGSVVGTIEPGAAPPKPAPAKQTAPKDDGKAAPVKEPPALSPAARAVAAEHGVDSAAITGTGRHGVVLKEDVQQRLGAPAAATPPTAAPPA